MSKRTKADVITIHNADTLGLGILCQTIRQGQGLSQMDLALNADVSQGRVAYLEKGYPAVGLDKIVQIFDGLGYTLDVVLRKVENEQT